MEMGRLCIKIRKYKNAKVIFFDIHLIPIIYPPVYGCYKLLYYSANYMFFIEKNSLFTNKAYLNNYINNK